MLAALLVALVSTASAQYVPGPSGPPTLPGGGYQDPNAQVMQMATLATATDLAIRQVVQDQAKVPTAACEAGDGAACVKAAKLWAQSGLVDAQLRALELYRKGCDAGDAGACQTAANACATGQGTSKDTAEAARLASKACDGGHASGCLMLARACERGDGHELDVAAALVAYQRACDASDREGCKEVGRLALTGGQGVNPDPDRSLAGYTRACELGSGDGCDKAGDHHRAAGDLVRAREAYDQGCDAGWRPACDHARSTPKR